MEGRPNSLQSLSVHILNELIMTEQYRQEFPCRPNNWLYIYSCLVLDITNKINNIKPDEAENKKKLANKRNKLIAKMNKIVELSKSYSTEKNLVSRFGKAFREVKLEQTFCLNGRIDTLQTINSMLAERE